MGGGRSAPTDLRPSPTNLTIPHKSYRCFYDKGPGLLAHRHVRNVSWKSGRIGELSVMSSPLLKVVGRDTAKDIPARWWCYSPKCLILCAVVTLMCSRARFGRSSITRWSSASVSRTSTHSSAYCASLASPISSICPSLSSIALLWLGVGIPRRITLTLGVLVAAWAIGVGLSASHAT